MNIIISALHFDWENMEDCLEKASAMGLDGVELSLHESAMRPHCTYEDLEYLRNSNSGRMSLTAHIWEDFPDMGAAAGSQAALRWIEICKDARISQLVVHGGSHTDRCLGLEILKDFLKEVAPALEDTGVILNLENHYAYDYLNCNELLSEPWEFLEVLGSVPSRRIKFCFDTGHGNMTRNSSELIVQLAPYLNYIHLADNRGIDDDHLPFRRGTTDWKGVFDDLNAVGFDGTFCVEFPVRDDRLPFNECLSEIRSRFGASSPNES